jgi:hypothetical protein
VADSGLDFAPTKWAGRLDAEVDSTEDWAVGAGMTGRGGSSTAAPKLRARTRTRLGPFHRLLRGNGNVLSKRISRCGGSSQRPPCSPEHSPGTHHVRGPPLPGRRFLVGRHLTVLSESPSVGALRHAANIYNKGTAMPHPSILQQATYEDSYSQRFAARAAYLSPLK